MLFGIGNEAEFRSQNQVIESPVCNLRGGGGGGGGTNRSQEHLK